MKITEREENGRYQATAFANGKRYDQVIYCDPLTGWPYDYKVKAHAAIRQAILREPRP
jgi:hypothetical protein